MARLPVPGGDKGSWGDVLNDYLRASHQDDGSLKKAALQAAGGVTSVNGKNPSTGNVALQLGDLSDVDTTGIADGEVLTYSSGAGKWLSATPGAGSIVPQPADYTITKSGANTLAVKTADGTNAYSGADAGAALTAAISALGANGGTIAFDTDTYTWSTVPELPANLNGWLRIVGHDSKINLTTAGSRFLDFNRPSAGVTFRNLHVEGFTVDAAALAAVGGTQHIILGTYRPSDGVTSGTDVNFEYIVLRNLRSLNVRVAPSGTAHHLNVFLGLHQSASGLPENHIEHVLIENIDMDGGNHGVTVYGNKSGSWTGDPSIRVDDIVIRHIRHDMRTTPTGFDAVSHVHVSSLAYGGDILIQDVWGYGSRDVGVEVDACMNARIENVVIVNYHGFAIALTNYNNPGEYRAQHVYARDIVGIRNAGIASPSSSSVVGIRTTPGLPNGHFTLENIKHYRSAGADDLSTSPIAGDLVSVKGSVESLTLDGGHYEAIGATLSGSSGSAAQVIYVDDLTSTRTRFTFNNIDIRFRGAKSVGATATIALFGIQLNGDVDFDINNLRMYVDFPNIEQVNAVDLGSANGGTMRGTVSNIKMYGPNLGSNPKGVFVPGSATVTIPFGGALRIRNVDGDALPAGAAVFINDATNKALVDQGIMPLSASARTVTADYTIVASDGVIFTNSAGNVTVSLPSGTTSGAGKEFIVKPLGSGNTFVNALGGNVDGLAQVTLTGAVAFVSDGTNWWSVSATAAAAADAVSFSARTVTADTSLNADDGVVIGNGASITLSLPSGTASGAGKQFTVKNIHSSYMFVNSLGGDIDGGAQVIVVTGHVMTFVSDGTNWIRTQHLHGEAQQGAVRTVTTGVNTVSPTDGTIFANGTGITVRLPAGTDLGGYKFTVKNIGTDPVTVDASGGTVEGSGSVILAASESAALTSDGTNWWKTNG